VNEFHQTDAFGFDQLFLLLSNAVERERVVLTRRGFASTNSGALD